MRRLILAITILLLAPALTYGAPPEVVSVRTGAHPDFDRLVVELDAPAPFIVMDGSGEVRLEIDGAALQSPEVEKGAKETELFDVDGVTSADGTVVVALKVGPGVRVKKSVYKKPFRVVVDFYPEGPPAKEEKAPAGSARVAAKKPAADDPGGPVKRVDNHKKEAAGDGGIKLRVSVTGSDDVVDVVKDFDEDADVDFSGG